jgi:hypothetical protein
MHIQCQFFILLFFNVFITSSDFNRAIGSQFVRCSDKGDCRAQPRSWYIFIIFQIVACLWAANPGQARSVGFLYTPRGHDSLAAQPRLPGQIAAI